MPKPDIKARAAGARLVEKYIDSKPLGVRNILEELRFRIKKIVPAADEDIKYGMPTIRLGGRNLVHFAAFANHIGFYPTPSAINAFQKELASYESSKGAIRFSLDKKLPHALIKKMVIFRLEELKHNNLK